jgi:Resolvase, N terminal domain
MNELLVGYARVSTEQQDLTAQRNGLRALGVGDDRIYVDHGLTGTNGTAPVSGSRWPPAEQATHSW